MNLHVNNITSFRRSSVHSCWIKSRLVIGTIKELPGLPNILPMTNKFLTQPNTGSHSHREICNDNHGAYNNYPSEDYPTEESISALADDTVEIEITQADSGMSTVEYAVGTIAAAAFAGILYKVVTGGQIIDSLTNIIMHALQSVG